ncbi:MAG: carbohydrate ABC transporter permease [Ruminococcus sp.]|nr:carbohydrate ABC transporter permease [Ruminococcus sp.]
MRKIIIYSFLILSSLIMIYPLLWLFGASMKTNSEIFTSIWFMPEKIDFTAYINGWKTSGEYTMGHFFINTFMIILPKTIFAVISSSVTAYGFARFDFPFKKTSYILLLAVMLMPQITTILPTYAMWEKFGMLDTYIPLTLPALFACEGVFVFILIQFFKGIPKELDEAAALDGCGAIKTLFYIHMPCIKPAIVSIGVFTFLWTMNDFMSPLIYISSVEKYPLTLALRMSIDSTGQGYEQNKIIAMSILGLIPSILIFGLAQKQFESGITTGGVSG